MSAGVSRSALGLRFETASSRAKSCHGFTQRTQDTLIKEYTLTYRGLEYYDLRYTPELRGIGFRV